MAGVGFGGGPIVGGLLIELFDWSAIFWMNVPIGIAGALLTIAFVRESRDPNARRLDLLGAALVSAGLFCLTFALVETDQHAWTSTFTLGFLGAAVALLALFVLHEARTSSPMLPLAFFRRRVFARANVLYAVLYAALAGTLFFVSLYFQNVQGYSALETGISWLVMNVPFLAVSVVAGRIQRRFGAGVDNDFCGCALARARMLIVFARSRASARRSSPLRFDLVDAYPPERRAWAIGIWATVAGFGFGDGQILGGLLIELFDWSAIFWMNVPIGIVGMLVTLAFVRESRDPNARRLDLGGPRSYRQGSSV